MRYRPPERKVEVPFDTKAFVKRWIFRVLLIIIFVAGFIFLFRAISYSKKLSVEDVQIAGTVYADSEKIKKSVERYLDDPILQIFSRKNIFLISRYRLEEFIKKEHKGLKGVTVDIEEKVVNIEIVEYKPDFLWCGDTPPLVWDEIVTCFYVSEDGFIFSKAPFFSGNVYSKFYGPLGDGFSIIPIGSRISNLTEFLALVEFKNEIRNIGLQPEAIALSGLDTITILLWRGESRSEDQISPKIIFDKRQDFKTLVRHLKAAIDQGELKDLLETKYDKLLYIDLRTDSKVFYKFLK